MNDVLKTYETVNGSVRLQYEEGVLYVTVLEGDIVHVSQKAGIQSYAIEDADHIKILQPEVSQGSESCRVRIAAGNIEVQVKDNEKLDIFYRGSDTGTTGGTCGRRRDRQKRCSDDPQKARKRRCYLWAGRQAGLSEQAGIFLYQLEYR